MARGHAGRKRAPILAEGHGQAIGAEIRAFPSAESGRFTGKIDTEQKVGALIGGHPGCVVKSAKRILPVDTRGSHSAVRPFGLRICALLAAALLGITWAWVDAKFILALRGDCQSELDAMRFSAYLALVTPDDGVELVGTNGKEQSRPDGTPWFRVAKSVAACFPDRLEGNQLRLPPDQWPEDFAHSLNGRILDHHPDASSAYPFKSEAGECVHSELLRLRAQADASVPDSYCGFSWWLPPLSTWLVEGLLPALGLFAAVWLLLFRRKKEKLGS